MEKGSSHNKYKRPVLVFDKDGVFGEQISSTLADQGVCVFVSKRVPVKKNQLLYIPYRSRIPKLPNSSFSFFYIVYSGDTVTLELLPAFVKKAKGEGTHIFFIITVRDASAALLEKVRDMSSIITTILVGDVFDKVGEWENPVMDMLGDVSRGMVLLPESGLSPVYPVALEDMLSVMLATSIHSEFSRVRTVYALPPHRVTALSFIRHLLKHEPMLQVDFVQGKLPRWKNAYAPADYASVLGSTYSYVDKVPMIQIHERAAAVKPSHKRRSLRIPTPTFMPMLYLVLGFLIFLFVCSSLVASAVGGGLLLQAKAHAENGDMSKVRSSASAAQHFFVFAERTSSIITSPLRLVNLDTSAENIDRSIATGKQASVLIATGAEGFQKITAVFHGSSLDPANDFQDGLYAIREAFRTYATLKAEGNIPRQYQVQTSQFEKAGATFLSLYDILPELMGFEKVRTYLVLFQNNMELRPGGGFIGSFALVTVDKGRIADFTIQDVYDADGQLKEHVEPPFQLKRYLGSQHWFLRDSNFDVDFTKNAAMAAYFYDLEMGSKVDGVIAVDTSFLRNILSATGPIHVAGYDEVVTSENFFILTESHAQNDFFPGSTQKKDFLAAVSNSLLLRLTGENKLDYSPIVSAIATSIDKKHILFTFPDQALQKVFTVNGMSSTLVDDRIVEPGIVPDFLGISEANIGQNKVNYYLDRVVSHAVQLGEEGVATETATIQYHNRSKNDSLFGGDYKNYLRLIVPKGAILQNVVIDGQQQTVVDAITDPSRFNTAVFRPPSGLEVEKVEQEGKTIFGFLLTVPKNSKKTVSVTYTFPWIVDKKSVHYSLRLFKQPGTEADPYLLSVLFPTTFRVLDANVKLQEQSGKVTHITDLAEDRSIDVKFATP